MNSLLITYLSGILRSINFLAFGTLIVSVWVGLYYFLEVGNAEIIEKYKGLLFKTLVISLVLSIFIPTSLDNKVLEAYMTENSKLRTQVYEMKLVINKNKLQHEIDMLERENLEE